MKDAPDTKQSERPGRAVAPAAGHAAQAARALVLAAATVATWAAQTVQAQPRTQTQAQTQAPPRALDRIVAVVENEAITERRLAKNLQRARTMLERQNREPPDERVLAGQVLQQMIVQQLQLQEAKRLGINIDDVALDRAVADAAKRGDLSLAEFKQKIESGGGSFEELREQMRRDMTIKRLVQREVIDQIKVSEQEVEDALNRDGARGGVEYRFARIRAQPDKDALDAAKRRMVEVRRALRADSTASIAGLRRRVARLWEAAGEKDRLEQLDYQVEDLGWRRPEELPAPVRRRLVLLRDTGIPVISNAGGVHVFHLLETRSGGPEMMQLQYRVRHILMKTNPVAGDDEIRRSLSDIKRRIEDGEDFGELACAYSEDPLSSTQDGELNWSSLDAYVPEFSEAVKRARGEGDVVGPFQTPFGWHVLEVLGTREQDVGDDAVRRRAVAQIRQSKSEEETRLWLLRLRENRRIEIRI